MIKVTSWSAESPDGVYYAEKFPSARNWRLFKMRGRGRGEIGVYPSFTAVVLWWRGRK